jgi:hypothetical protein
MTDKDDQGNDAPFPSDESPPDHTAPDAAPHPGAHTGRRKAKAARPTHTVSVNSGGYWQKIGVGWEGKTANGNYFITIRLNDCTVLDADALKDRGVKLCIFKVGPND